MKRVIIRKPFELDLIQEEQPIPQPGEVLLKIKAIGICGSDLHVFEGKHPFVSYPVLPGHEVSGEIVAAGAGVDGALVGKSAVIEPSLAEGIMPRFAPGRYNISTDLRVMGFQVPGAMSEYFTVPLGRIHLLPDDFSHELGVVVEPTAVAVHGVRLVSEIAGMDVAVLGAGTIGLLVAQVAGAYGAASVTVVEPDASRRSVAQSLGMCAAEELAKNSCEVIFECVGNAAALQSAIYGARKGGTVIVLGVFGKDVLLPVGLIQDWELRLQGSLMYVGDDYREAIRLLERKLVRVDGIITHRFALTDAPEAFGKALERGSVLKVLLENE